MAKVEIVVDQSDGHDFRIINVKAVVGSYNAVNHTDDVMVVQALLKYWNYFSHVVPPSEAPEPTGAFNKATGVLIRKFQDSANLNRMTSKRVATDGRVSHARGKFEWGKNYRWTIVSLNEDVLLCTTALGRSDHIEEICNQWPQVRTVLNKGNSQAMTA